MVLKTQQVVALGAGWLVAYLPILWFAWSGLRSQDQDLPWVAVGKIYRASTIKFCLTTLLFAALFIGVGQVSVVGVFTGFIAAQILAWSVIATSINCRRE